MFIFHMPIYAEAKEQLSECSFAKTCLPAPRNCFVCLFSYDSFLRPVNSIGKVAGYGLKQRDSVPGRVTYLCVLKTSISDLGYRSPVRVGGHESRNTPLSFLGAEVKNA
jgi:hypothetical protein